jgi:hypothetical protein
LIFAIGSPIECVAFTYDKADNRHTRHFAAAACALAARKTRQSGSSVSVWEFNICSVLFAGLTGSRPDTSGAVEDACFVAR